VGAKSWRTTCCRIADGLGVPRGWVGLQYSDAGTANEQERPTALREPRAFPLRGSRSWAAPLSTRDGKALPLRLTYPMQSFFEAMTLVDLHHQIAGR
jgi:hypothetical protein